MKTAYELAMERLGKTSPTVKLTAAQKREMAELDSICKAKIAEREIATRDEIEKAISAGEDSIIAELRERLHNEKAKFEADREARKSRIRGGA